jgi:hypothetical protein
MANMQIDFLRRTGSATSAIRQIVAVSGHGKQAVEKVLSTPITKITWAPEFRHGGSHKPIEQYCFEVRGKRYERFADATAVVMKIHHIAIAPNEVESAQQYVKQAVAILEGKAPLRVLSATDVPQDAVLAEVVREAA